MLSKDGLLGKDQNHNGVRDDIEHYIDTRASKGSNKYLALVQLAKDYQNAFKVVDQQDEFKKACHAIRQSDDCVIATFGNYDEVFNMMPEQFDNFARSRAGAKMEAEHFRSISLLPLEDRPKCCDFLNNGKLGCHQWISRNDY